MSVDHAANLQLFPPTASGRSSPAPRAARNAAQDSLYKKDKGFRRYAAGVERALALWDSAQQEWADYISFLGRLLKALQAHPSEIAVVPHSDTVALRLAQCLNPALPSGVHQKALDVYAYIFATIGKDALAHDLNIYFPGLASVLSFASLTVRPLFLTVFESYILKLGGEALRPALKAVILSLLPGLEDETSEDFERMVAALDKLRKVIEASPEDRHGSKSSSGSSHFWQCFFLATITNASRRQGALAFLVRRLPKFGLTRQLASGRPTGLTAEAEAAISPEPGLLIRCFESGLSDPQLLIQRGFLDLLVSHLPLDSPVLQQSISKEDLERLVAAAAGVVARRDMSLNRRLWAWFLGPDPTVSDSNGDVTSPTQDKHGDATDSSTQHAAFFSRHGLEALTSSVLKIIRRDTKSPVERARPFRICLSLMDRWEVGGLIVPEIFLPALQSVQSYTEFAPREQADEVLRSASAFFDGVDSGLIWGKLIHLVTSSLSSELSRNEALQRMKLAKFVLARFNLKEEDMLLHHMPLMVLSTLASLNAISRSPTKPSLDPEVSDLALEITDSLVQMVPDRALQSNRPLEQRSRTNDVSRDEMFQQITLFYEDSQGSMDATEVPLESATIGKFMLREAAHMFVASLKTNTIASSPEMRARILANIIFKSQDLTALDEYDLSTVFQGVLARPTMEDVTLTFSHLSAVTIVLTALQISRPASPYLPVPQVPELVHLLATSLWNSLSPVRPKYHVEAVRCLLQLHTISPESRMVEAAISSIIIEKLSGRSKDTENSECARTFAILWSHTIYELNSQSDKRGAINRRLSGMNVPTLSLAHGEYHAILTRPLLLLLDPLSDDETETSAFMISWLQDLPSLSRVLEILVYHIQSLQCITATGSLVPGNTPANIRTGSRQDDSKDCLYYLNHMLNILKRPARLVWITLAETSAPTGAGPTSHGSLQEWLARTCLITVNLGVGASKKASHMHDLHRTSMSILSSLYQSPFAAPLGELELEVPLMERLKIAVPALQSPLLGTTISALRLRLTRGLSERSADLKVPNHPSQRSRLSLALNRDSEDNESPPVPPPAQLIDCLKFGFSSPTSRLVLDDWVHFLVEVLPMFTDAIFQNLLPLVECLCTQITVCFDDLRDAFSKREAMSKISPEATLISLINGLEQILAKAHDRLAVQELKVSANKSPEQPQGFFSNVVSGVFTSDTNQSRTPTANSRLTVLLCFQDTVRICFAIWSWGGYGHSQSQPDSTSASSFAYTSLRMRNRARRILEHLFAAEALECLETLAVLWSKAKQDDDQEAAIVGLLNVLNGSRPKHTIPAIFNAVYSRTDPNALDPNRMSTLTSDLSDTELVSFLVEYTRSLEDDAMDEIWQDCTLFLRDVLANPLPHRQVLPTLLEFTAVIGQKVDNTNFGEQRKMRRELGDIFARILTAIFTTRSMGYVHDATQASATEKYLTATNGKRAQKRATDVVAILSSIVPSLPVILAENDRVAKVVSDISTSVIGPTFRAKAFPDNVSSSLLDLLQKLTAIATGNKLLKKDISDAFNDPRFFNTPLPLLRESWLPILAQWTQSDKDRIPELLTRISAPTTAGIMFGVGASSARQEADRKTQLTLRRISLLILASPEDAFTPSMPSLLEKTVELLSATPATSPSSATRADVLVLLRSMILKTSPVHLAPIWPVVNGELTASLSSLLPDAKNKEHYNNAGILQACKLLDQLVVLDPDDFQLSEWLFICDTIDAVYKPATPLLLQPLTDEISEVLAGEGAVLSAPMEGAGGTRTLFLESVIKGLEEEGVKVGDLSRGDLVGSVIRPFLGNLAMGAFEARYGGGEVDMRGVWESCVGDAGA